MASMSKAGERAEVNQYTCEKCGRVYKLKHSLDQHLRILCKEKPYPCTSCDKDFKLKQTLTRHMFVHTEEKPFSCYFCRKVSSRSDIHRKHEMRCRARNIRVYQLESTSPNNTSLHTIIPEFSAAIGESAKDSMFSMGFWPSNSMFSARGSYHFSDSSQQVYQETSTSPNNTSSHPIIPEFAAAIGESVKESMFSMDFSPSISMSSSRQSCHFPDSSQQASTSTAGEHPVVNENSFEEYGNVYKRNESLKRYQPMNSKKSPRGSIRNHTPYLDNYELEEPVQTHTEKKQITCANCCRKFSHDNSYSKHKSICSASNILEEDSSKEKQVDLINVKLDDEKKILISEEEDSFKEKHSDLINVKLDDDIKILISEASEPIDEFECSFNSLAREIQNIPEIPDYSSVFK